MGEGFDAFDVKDVLEEKCVWTNKEEILIQAIDPKGNFKNYLKEAYEELPKKNQ